jgi:hypothetical protein
VNCTLWYANDPCTNACNAANHLTQGESVYDPKVDEIYSHVTVQMLGVAVDQVR